MGPDEFMGRALIISIAKFKFFFPETFTLLKLFETMHFKKGVMVSIFIADIKLTTPPMHGTSGNLWLQLKSLAMLLTHTLKS